MGFLDNSGDIILDAVLTDTGRMRLARGDGTFRIAKFALGDDEINYGSYNKNHASGSAYYDLEILQSPVLEAFTNNTSLMKSKLISIPRTNLLYLPILKLADESNSFPTSRMYNGDQHTPRVENTYIVTVDERTEGINNSPDKTLFFGPTDVTTGQAKNSGNGVLAGFVPAEGANHIEVHQGLDTSEIPPNFTIDADLQETQYIIEIDNRLGSIVQTSGTPTPVNFVDDDNIASYYISQGGTSGYITSLGIGTSDSVIAGPRGTLLKFKIKSSIELSVSSFLFTKLGGTWTTADGSSKAFYYIDTTVRITGATTGYRLDVPLRFVKKT